MKTFSLRQLFYLLTLCAVVCACFKDVWIQNGLFLMTRSDHLIGVYMQDRHWVVALWHGKEPIGAIETPNIGW